MSIYLSTCLYVHTHTHTRMCTSRLCIFSFYALGDAHVQSLQPLFSSMSAGSLTSTLDRALQRTASARTRSVYETIAVNLGTLPALLPDRSSIRS